MTSQQSIGFCVENYQNEGLTIERLYNLIQLEEWDLIDQFIDSKENIQSLNFNFIDNDSGDSLLTALAKKAKIQLIEKFLELGADINFASRNKSTVLHISVKTGSEDLVTLILNKNGNPNLPNEKNQLPLHLACGKPKISLSIIKLLLRKSDKTIRLAHDSLGYISLHYAIKAIKIEACTELLNEFSQEQLSSKTLTKKDTALHLACKTKSIDLIHFLLEKGAQVNTQNIDFQTPLHLSCWEGDVNAVDLFYYYNADGNITDKVNI
jgi:ankyrin repeat protein